VRDLNTVAACTCVFRMALQSTCSWTLKGRTLSHSSAAGAPLKFEAASCIWYSPFSAKSSTPWTAHAGQAALSTSLDVILTWLCSLSRATKLHIIFTSATMRQLAMARMHVLPVSCNKCNTTLHDVASQTEHRWTASCDQNPKTPPLSKFSNPYMA
jgi:hypothetical protein